MEEELRDYIIKLDCISQKKLTENNNITFIGNLQQQK